MNTHDPMPTPVTASLIALAGALLTKLGDSLAASWRGKKADAATVQVARVQDYADERKLLWERIEHLEKRIDVMAEAVAQKDEAVRIAQRERDKALARVEHLEETVRDQQAQMQMQQTQISELRDKIRDLEIVNCALMGGAMKLDPLHPDAPADPMPPSDTAKG